MADEPALDYETPRRRAMRKEQASTTVFSASMLLLKSYLGSGLLAMHFMSRKASLDFALATPALRLKRRR